MNTKRIKVAWAAIAMILGLSGASSALAFDTGIQGLGFSPVSTDVWQLTCPAGTVSARAQVRDILPPAAVPMVRIGVFKPGFLPLPTVQAPQEGLSLVVGRFAGSGAYHVIVSKDLAGVESYRAVFNCHNAAGGILPGAVVRLQNQ